MGFRFRKSIRLGRGVRLNVGKRGISSISVGRRGMRVSAGRRGVRSTVSLPGTGVSYSKRGCALPGCAVPIFITFGASLVVMFDRLRHMRTQKPHQ